MDKSAVPEMVPVAVILSGPRRGHSDPLVEKTYRIVMRPDEALYFLPPDDRRAQKYHATLHRIANTYEVAATADRAVWVNGEQVTGTRILKAGDLLEIGHRGPVVRYRLYPAGTAPRKTFAEAVVDSYDSAQVDGLSRIGRISTFLGNVTRDLATQTTLWFRIWILIIVTILVASIVMLIAQSVRLQKKVATEEARISSIEQKLAEQDVDSLTMKDLLSLKAEVNTQLADTLARLAEIEKGAGKAYRIIAQATPSVVFLLGSYGFTDPLSGKMLRSVDMGGGVSHYTVGDEGNVVELVFSGTAFAVSESGLLLTNLHVVEPWLRDPESDIAHGRGLTPSILKLYAYYPGSSDHRPVEMAYAGENIDLALLRPTAGTAPSVPLEVKEGAPQPGEEVIVLGYPAGLRALVARASPDFLKSISPNGPVDYWTVAQRLSEAGYIKPLATRGIVGQVTADAVVYDAETTFGGSGGPVFDLDGRVVAINAAIMAEFGGANMGIPAERIRQFLDQFQSAKAEQD
jgi:S1-C subfamily serine protease